jgi:hypothetical protein
VKRRLWALVCGWLLTQHLAHAKSPVSASARLELVKAPGTEPCLDRQSLSRAVEARLQRRAFRADLPATLYVNISITRSGDAWSALLRMHDGSGAFLGRRSIVTRAADCSALDDSLALVVALLVDSPPAPVPHSDEGSAVRAEPEKAPPKTAPLPASTAAKAPQNQETSTIHLPPDTPAPRAPWSFSLAAEGSGAFGMLPGFAPGVELGFGAKAPTLPEIRLFGGVYAQREQQSNRPGPESGARFDFAYVGLELCPVSRQFGAFEWFVCAGQSLGRLKVASFGFDENLTSGHLSYALLVRSGVQLALASRLAARLGIRAEVPFSRGVFSYGAVDGSQQELFETKPVTAVLDLGLVVRL